MSGLKPTGNENTLLSDKLKAHWGHELCVTCYKDRNGEVSDVCLECLDCGEVVLDGELYTLKARNDIDG